MTKVLNVEISDLSFVETVKYIDDCIINESKSKYICICNTHSLIEGKKNQKHAMALNDAELCTPDGMPLVWELNRKNKQKKNKKQERVDGPNLMEVLCRNSSYKIFLLGGTNQTLDILENNLKLKNPNINIVGTLSPPFKKMTKEENEEILKTINDSHADIVFVSLGCPKQEIWMNQNYKKVDSILIGVGAAFDFHTNKIKRAPEIMQKLGMEWSYRLFQDPKRLWKRYLINNSLYIYHILISMYRKKE